jgi:cytochrome c peroxidase
VRWYIALSTFLAGAAALGGCDESALQVNPEPVAVKTAPAPSASASAVAAKVTIDPADLAFFKPLPERFESDKNPITEAKVKLGRLLFYENRFSIGQDLSCNSCHDLAKYGVDNEPTSFGHKKQRGARNSPTVYNAAAHFAQFWDGRAASIEDQAKGPILNPVEMAMPNEAHVLKVLKSIPEYEKSFKEAFPKAKDPINYDNVANAIGAFERQLVTPGRWDKFLQGNDSALTEAEKAGFALFAKLGCPTCHNGPAVGGRQFQKLGLVKPYPDQSDLGRYVVTKDEADKMYFRVPSLRNIDKTAPYFHNGSIPTLEIAVKTMADHQLGMALKDSEITSIVTWLKSLTGELPAAYIAKPDLPPSTDKTPKAKLD